MKSEERMARKVGLVIPTFGKSGKTYWEGEKHILPEDDEFELVLEAFLVDGSSAKLPDTKLKESSIPLQRLIRLKELRKAAI